MAPKRQNHFELLCLSCGDRGSGVISFTKIVAWPLSDKHFSFADTVVRSISRFAVAMLMARLIGRNGYSLFVLLTAVELTFISIANSLYVAPMLVLAPGRSPEVRDGLYRLVGRKLSRLAAGVIIVGLVLLPVLAWRGVPVTLVVGFLLNVVALSYLQAARGRLSAEFRSHRSLCADTVAVLFVLAGLGVVSTLGLAALNVYWWLSAVGGLAALLITGAVGTNLGSVSPDLSERYGSMGRHMAVGTASNTLCSRAQPFVLAFAGGPWVVSAFGAAATFVGPIRLLSMSISGLLRPRFSLYVNRHNPQRLRRLFGLTIVGFGMFGAVSLCVSLVAGEALIRLAFGPEFGGMRKLLPWAVIFASVEAVGATVVILVQSALPNGAAVATRWRIAALVVSSIVIWPASVSWGAAGAFAATSVVESIFVIPMLWIARGAFARTEYQPAPTTASAAAG